MITIKLIGGLGNQMFQYALYKALELKGYDVCLDDDTYFNKQNAPDYLAYHLDIFNLKYNRMNPDKMPDYLVNPKNVFFRIFHKFQCGPFYFEKESSRYDPNIFKIASSNKYLIGYWQTEKYFCDYKYQIKNDFQYIGEWNEQNTYYREAMSQCESVSMHIRRGDYLKSGRYTGICTEDYYIHALNYIKAQINNPHFFVFSNDLEWCKSLLSNEENVVYVEGNDVNHSYMDMVLMTYCKHHVIANSSFSWWGAWLGQKEGITISPMRWLQNIEAPDIWCDGWIKMD